MTAGRPVCSLHGEPTAERMEVTRSVAPLSPRARERLRLAAGLLRAGHVRIDDSAGFYEGVLVELDMLSVRDRARVRALVDWLEAYCIAEALAFGGSARR